MQARQLRSGPEQCSRDHRNSIRPSVGELARGDHCRIRELRPEAVTKPAQVPHVGVVDSSRELDLEGHNASSSLHDEVDFPENALVVLAPLLKVYVVVFLFK